jgi:hypothetical protein
VQVLLWLVRVWEVGFVVLLGFVPIQALPFEVFGCLRGHVYQGQLKVAGYA